MRLLLNTPQQFLFLLQRDRVVIRSNKHSGEDCDTDAAQWDLAKHFKKRNTSLAELVRYQPESELDKKLLLGVFPKPLIYLQQQD